MMEKAVQVSWIQPAAHRLAHSGLRSFVQDEETSEISDKCAEPLQSPHCSCNMGVAFKVGSLV